MNLETFVTSFLSSTCFTIHILLILSTQRAQSQKTSHSHFDWALTKEVGTGVNENVIISPISAKILLAMLYQGAGGNTSTQLEYALNLPKNQRDISTLHFSSILRTLQNIGLGVKNKLYIGSKVFVDTKTHLNEFYNETLTKIFNASVESVAFANTNSATDKINKWASSATRGNIKELIAKGDAKENTMVLLLNAIYFKGQWNQPFPPNQTRDGFFRLSSTKSVPVTFMNCLQTQRFAEAFELESWVLRLPYGNDEFAMYIIMPISSDGIDKLLERITPEKIEEALQNMDDVELNVSLPKFHFDFVSSLRPALEKVGVSDMFNEKADLSGITKDHTDHLLVSDVIQKAGIFIDEEGSTAYVATQADLVSKFGDHVTSFVVDRPFLFFIRDETMKTNIFVGKVVNPAPPGTKPIERLDPRRPVIRPAMYPGIHYQPDTNGISGGRPTDSSADKRRPAIPPVRRPLNEESTNMAPSTTSQQNQTVEESFSGFMTPESGYFMPNGEYIKQSFDQERFSFFDTELLLNLCEMESKSNLVFSPASVKTVLSMLYEGAAMDTERELSTVLRLPKNRTRALKTLHSVQNELHSPSGPQVRWLMANRLLFSPNLPTLPEYNQAMNHKYHADVEQINFESATETANNINNWVSDVTQGFITTLVSPDVISKDAQLILLNAVYFKGDWQHPFNRKFSHSECFYPEIKQCKKVNMMTQRAFFKYGYYKQLLAHILELPYSDSRYSMVIVLPSNEGGLIDLLKDLPLCPILPFLNDIVPAEVQLTMPSFKVEVFKDLTASISQIGATSIFSDKADLRYMLGQRRGKVTKIVHKAKIVVNEIGTEAGAGTAGVIVPLMNTQLIQLTVNQPFLYFIRDLKTGFIFSGRIYDPSSN